MPTILRIFIEFLEVLASTASIYAHTEDAAHDEATGTLGGQEAGVPDYWAYSVAIARAWELALEAADTPHTRKVALRTGFTMSADANGIFDWMKWLAAIGFGGRFAGGQQFISWIAGEDWARAVLFCIEQDTLNGPVNLTAPEPVRQHAFMAPLVAQQRVPVAFPIPGLPTATLPPGWSSK